MQDAGSKVQDPRNKERWNVGTLEWWNDGILGNREMKKVGFNCHALLIIRVFHYSSRSLRSAQSSTAPQAVSETSGIRDKRVLSSKYSYPLYWILATDYWLL